jgi:hypothetical protein
MNRSVYLVLFCALLGCNDTHISKTGPDLGGFIGPVPKDGGTVAVVDLASTGQKYGCHAYVGCVVNCYAGATTTPTTCLSTCEKLSNTDVPMLYDAALGCGQTWCVNKNVTGGAAYKCAVSGSQLTELNGDPVSDTGNCGLCLSNALADLFSDMCANTSSIDCNPSSCATATSACLGDLP